VQGSLVRRFVPSSPGDSLCSTFIPLAKRLCRLPRGKAQLSEAIGNHSRLRFQQLLQHPALRARFYAAIFR